MGTANYIYFGNSTILEIWQHTLPNLGNLFLSAMLITLKLSAGFITLSAVSTKKAHTNYVKVFTRPCKFNEYFWTLASLSEPLSLSLSHTYTPVSIHCRSHGRCSINNFWLINSFLAVPILPPTCFLNPSTSLHCHSHHSSLKSMSPPLPLLAFTPLSSILYRATKVTFQNHVQSWLKHFFTSFLLL